MKHTFLILILLITSSAFSQEEIKSSTIAGFAQFEISIPLQGNQNLGEEYPDGTFNNNWFLPDGVNANFGYGIHYKKWLGITANSGIGMILSQKLVIAPVFANLRIMPKVGEETRLGIDFGLGQSFALGRGNLQGTFQRAKLNLESDGRQLFIEFVSYGINFNNTNQQSISIGIALVSF